MDAGLLQSVASECRNGVRFGPLAIDDLDSSHRRALYLRTGIQMEP